jgi:release factor glutamine methyltransferase
MTISGALDAAAARLERAGVPEPRLNAELLLADLLDVDRGGLLVRGRDVLDPAVAQRFEERVLRRTGREPLQHITGFQEFRGLAFEVDGRVLVPRPESEGLIEAALALDLPDDACVADLGTGSGCLAVSLASARERFRLHALDSSAAALEVARSNARRHGVEQRIDFRRAAMGEPPAVWMGRIDLVISNPPYVSEDEWAGLEPEVRDHDPRGALVAGPTGLEGYRELLPAARGLLRENGLIVIELGFGQTAEVERMACAEGFGQLRVERDFQNIPRVLVAAVGRAR